MPADCSTSGVDGEHRTCLTYRPDIDGLRALAVGSVIFFHAGIPGFSGGYVGVDVFFVISGYLITHVILGSKEPGLALRLKEFYLRRCRRIVPALVVMLAVTTVTALLLLLPADFIRIGKFLAATPVFLSNLASWSETGYFDEAAARNPLVHLWSIAVEEQFYLAYPVFLVLISTRFARYRGAALILITVASLMLSILGSSAKPSATFYFAPTRAWELSTGAIMALGIVRMPTRPLMRELLATVALLSILVVIATSHAGSPFAGIYALVPCLAAAILVAPREGEATFIGKLLSLRPVLFVGVISYSLYLWHAPVFSLYQYYRIETPGAPEVVGLIVAVFLIAWASSKFIERPVRMRVVLRSNWSLVTAAIVGNYLIAVVGLFMWKSNGMPARFQSEVLAFARAARDLHPDTQRCMSLSLPQIESGGVCRFGSAGQPRVVVWGDSHAAALLPAYEELANRYHVDLYFAAESACRPLIGVVNRRQPKWRQDACLNFNAAMGTALGAINPRVVILSAHWIDSDSDLLVPPKSTGTADSNFKRALKGTIDLIHSRRQSACVVLGVPDLPYPAAHALAIATKRLIPYTFLRVTRAHAQREYLAVEHDIRLLANDERVTIADPKELLCRQSLCDVEFRGESLYRDTGHLSTTGAKFVAGALEPCFRAATSANR